MDHLTSFHFQGPCVTKARFGSPTGHTADCLTTLQVANVSSILARHPEALIAGAPFPDYLYTCGTDHGAGRTRTIFNICEVHCL